MVEVVEVEEGGGGGCGCGVVLVLVVCVSSPSSTCEPGPTCCTFPYMDMVVVGPLVMTFRCARTMLCDGPVCRVVMGSAIVDLFFFSGRVHRRHFSVRERNSPMI